MGTATLELAPLPLHQQIQDFAKLSQSWGYSQVKILPLFLSSGVHVNTDLPAEIAIAQAQIGSEIQLNLLPYFGSQVNRLAPWIATKMATVEMENWILIAHGSRHPGGNQPMEQLAAQIGAIPAYWSVSPNLETQIQVLISQGVNRIGIIPYFMFSGGITDAISQSIQQFSQQFPTVEFNLISPLEIDENLVNLIRDLLL
ncbi:MAG: CbiX/SirB N-terminal domain-containing protein [Planktothrix sp. GU0601_MAG3]|nr:MAG: CbiX/SirB N-terminal domain-containing protein [Planktothrix sp. GU0601_MAG3]